MRGTRSYDTAAAVRAATDMCASYARRAWMRWADKTGCEYADLYSAGMLGLCMALDAHDRNNARRVNQYGVKLSYLVMAIRSQIYRYIQQELRHANLVDNETAYDEPCELTVGRIDMGVGTWVG